MRFPWVGRVALDQANAELSRVYDLFRHERDRNGALMLEIVNLRRDGFMKPGVVSVPDAPRPIGEPLGDGIDEVVQHYADLSANPPAAKRVLDTLAIRLRVEGKTPEAIIAAIHRGDPVHDGDDD